MSLQRVALGWMAAALLVVACVDDATDGEPGGGGEGGGALGGDGAGGAGQGEGGSTQNQAGNGSAGGFGGEAADGGAGGGVTLMGEPCQVGSSEGVCVDVSECTIEGWAPTPGFCPGPAEIQCCHPLPADSCDPDAMPLPNAGLEEAPGTGGCPDGMMRVTTFCVDRFEAFLVTLEGDPVSPYFNPGDEQTVARSAAGAVPQGYINQWQASDACENAGKRLCTDNEWLRACRGPSSFTYPYGNTLEPGVCNDDRDQHPAIEYFMTSEDWIWSELGHPCLNQLEDGLATAGTYAGCASTEGAFDLMGNLHEWTADPNGTFRGGFYVDTIVNGPGCLYATTAHDVSHWDYSTGFRCCADP